jgi:5-formyltetrahydrofolate cyclo-ligase
LPAAYVAGASRAVQGRFLDSPSFDAATTLVLYAAKDNEIETDLILEEALGTHRRVLFPRVVVSSGELLLVRVDSSAELAPGAFGVLEPTGAEVVPVANLGPSLICVPGLAFTPGGQRLGRGGGYYDRLLAEAGPQSESVGLAYSFQVLDQIPQSLGDQWLDLILTESTSYRLAAIAQSLSQWADQGGVPKC